jgi:phosphoglycolate phosphatase
MANIIFDFDGTIADSLPVVTELFYNWAKIEPYGPRDLERLRNSTLKEVLHEVGVPLWRVPRLMVKARTEFGKRLKDVPIFANMPETLKRLHDNGYNLHVISSNSPQNIRQFLRRHDIMQYFKGIHGNTGIFGKASAMRSIILRYKIDRNNCYYIGDETRDVDAAQKAHIKSVAVTWGYNGEKILKAHNPDYIAHTPSELIKLLQ